MKLDGKFWSVAFALCLLVVACGKNEKNKEKASLAGNWLITANFGTKTATGQPRYDMAKNDSFVIQMKADGQVFEHDTKMKKLNKRMGTWEAKNNTLSLKFQFHKEMNFNIVEQDNSSLRLLDVDAGLEFELKRISEEDKNALFLP